MTGPGWRVALGRGLRRRCPVCGHRLFDTYFRMRPVCPGCRVLTDRGEHDAFLGAVLLNFITAEVLSVAAAVVIILATWPSPAWRAALWVAVGLAVALPIAGYPYSRGLWLAVDSCLRPPVFQGDLDRPDA